MQLLRDFFNYMFARRRKYIGRLEKGRAPESKLSTEDGVGPAGAGRIVSLVTYFMGAVLIGSLLLIFVLVVLFPDRAVPAIVHDIFFTTLGYFGGAFAAFLELRG